MFGFAARLIGGMADPLIDQVSAAGTRLLKKLALFAAAGICGIVVLIALTVAFDLWIASLAGAIVGALAVAGVYFVIAVACVLLALRKPLSERGHAAARDHAEAARSSDERAAEDPDPIAAFTAPLLAILSNLGLRREQFAVLAGSSLARQLGPIPLVGLAVVGGFFVGRMWTGWRALLSGDLIAALLSSDLLAGLFGTAAARQPGVDEPSDDA